MSVSLDIWFTKENSEEVIIYVAILILDSFGFENEIYIFSAVRETEFF
jgi:hypothetical protein